MTATCNRCGWVHFEVSRQFAESEVKDFNKYFESLSKQDQEDFYGGKGASMSLYENCHTCGETYKNFRDSLMGDCPDGCTIGPIISRKE